MEETNMNLEKELAMLQDESYNPQFQMAEALSKYLEAIKADYFKENSLAKNPDAVAIDVRNRMMKEFESKLHVVEGKTYYKVVADGAHSFIVKEDGPKFKRGDILKAVSWNAPAKNQARGNIFGEYKTLWTGTWYLR
jgi:hypothetical protein